jgi:transglutaminase-like putative cysteine protease
MIYHLEHTTRYDYDAPVDFSIGQAHQLAADVDGQRCLERELVVSPLPEYYRERTDYFGNLVGHYSVREPHTTLEVVSRAVINTDDRPESVDQLAADESQASTLRTRPWEDLVGGGPDAPIEVTEYAFDSPLVVRSEALADYARVSFTEGRPMVDAVRDLRSRIFSEFEFDPVATDVNTPLETVMTIRRGVCQDFAHVMIGCLRSLGLAARYVSGYLETIPPPGKERLVGADRTHAWVGVYLGDGHWLGEDPTNDQLAGTRYVTTARGRDYRDVPPLKGIIFTDAEESTLTVAVDVAPQSSEAEPDQVLPGEAPADG